jgi:ABC-type Co2+ transport system permease subunit
MSGTFDQFNSVFHGDSVFLGVVAFVAAFFGLLALRWDRIAANLQALGRFFAPILSAVLTAGTTALVLVATGIVPSQGGPVVKPPPVQTSQKASGKGRDTSGRTAQVAQTKSAAPAYSGHNSLHDEPAAVAEARIPVGPSEAVSTPSVAEHLPEAEPEVVQPEIAMSVPACPSFAESTDPLAPCELI